MFCDAASKSFSPSTRCVHAPPPTSRDGLKRQSQFHPLLLLPRTLQPNPNPNPSRFPSPRHPPFCIPSFLAPLSLTPPATTSHTHPPCLPSTHPRAPSAHHSQRLAVDEALLLELLRRAEALFAASESRLTLSRVCNTRSSNPGNPSPCSTRTPTPEALHHVAWPPIYMSRSRPWTARTQRPVSQCSTSETRLKDQRDRLS